MKAIRTVYFGPGNVRGSRVKASDEDGNSATVSYDHALNGEGNHREAARALCLKMGWDGDLIGGSVRKGYVWVFHGGPVLSVVNLKKAANG